MANLYEMFSWHSSEAVDASTSQADIKRVFRKAVLILHPDKQEQRRSNGLPSLSTAEAQRKFKELNNAMEILRDKDKRRDYDN